MRLGMVILLIGGLTLAGCATSTAPGGDQGGEELTPAQERAIQAVLDAVEGIGRSAAAAAPAAKAPAIQNGDLNAFACMDLASQAATDIVELQIQFGGACDPGLFIAASASGSVTGSVHTGTGALELSFAQFAVNDEATDGTWAGSSARSNGVTSFSVDVDLVLDVGEGILDGHVDVEVDEETGVTRIVGGTVNVEGMDFSTVTIDFAGAEIDFMTNGGFNPQAGGATLSVPGDVGTEQLSLQFSPQTATGSSVMVQTQSGSSFEYSEPEGED